MLVHFENLEKEYVNEDLVTPVLRGITLQIDKGEFIAIMGPSGSGKSTMMHIMGFLDRLSHGTYLFDGKDVSTLTDDELALMRRHKVGFIFQAFNLLAKSSVLDNVMLPMLYAGTPPKERIERAREAIHAVGLEHRVNNLSNQLSGGERQRVAIARAFVNNPTVVFADEPTGNLDTKTGEHILELLTGLHRKGNTIVMVTHEDEAAAYAERTIRLRDGLIVSDQGR